MTVERDVEESFEEATKKAEERFKELTKASVEESVKQNLPKVIEDEMVRFGLRTLLVGALILIFKKI